MVRLRRSLAALAVVALVVVAGCNASVGTGSDHPTGDPDADTLGWEGGYWYDDAVPVTPGNGYNASERQAVVNRTMARIERIRGLEFNRSVPVDVISREQYRANHSSDGNVSTHERWNDQVWEGLFIVSEDRGTANAFDSTLGASVLGYYSPGEDSIVLVSDSATPTVDRNTLAHELVHALQDQQFGLGPNPDTQDRQLAADSVVEGEANLVERRYRSRCDGRWSCLPRPDDSSGSNSGSGSGSGNVNRGLLLTILTPYTAGQSFVAGVQDASGWDAVNDLHDAEPNSTEQVIHPSRYPDEQPVNVTVPDRSSGGWHRFDHDPVADTVGEASVYAMFFDNGIVDVPADERYRYQSDPSAGWGGDALVPYRKNGTAPDEGAYVWKTVWDTERDARQFANAYRQLLREHDAQQSGENVYVVPESDPYDDAFRVVREGKTVRVVNAPTVEALDAVHEPE